MNPVVIDLYCGAGGCTKGYQRAGFYVIGVDKNPQPRYCGDEFFQGDAIEIGRNLLATRLVHAIHASPPCQAFTSLRNSWNAKPHANLIPETRELLAGSGLPYVIENVPGAPLINPILLCGTMFRLGCEGAELRRHRYFECNGFELGMIPPCEHGWSASTIGVYGHRGDHFTKEERAVRKARVIGVYGGHGRDRRRVTAPQDFPTEARREAMGIDWMTGTELSQAIPPDYTAFIGRHLMAAVMERAA